MRELQPGVVLGTRYKIENCIGAGGMGVVYRARRTILGDVVAIKILRSGKGKDAALRKQFMAEARMCAMLRHPYIVSVLDFGVEKGIGPYFVMEHLNGQSLRQLLEAQGALDVGEVCRITSQVAAALDLAHSQGITHRDLKPGNVIAHRYTAGEVSYKVIDFGIGDLRRPKMGRSPLDDSDRIYITRTYASPEQLTGQPVGPPSDIYSLGITVYELLTGHPPFADSKSTSLFTKHLTVAPVPPSRIRPEVPRWAESAVLKALAKEPTARWETASEFAEALSGSSHRRTAPVSPSASRLADAYEIRGQIGRGRFDSYVYEGTHRATGHKVAIRVIRRGQDPHWDSARIPFMREARMTPVNHPSILRVRDYGEERDLVYVVTDLVPGSSLRELMDRSGPIPWSRGRHLMLDLIGAAQALHARGLLAFGLTPSIVRVDGSGKRELLVVSSAGAADIDEVLAHATADGAKGSESAAAEAAYLAPELLIGEKPDGRSDVFMIGAIAYELFTGRRPFAAGTLPRLVAATFSGDIANPQAYAPSLPDAAAACILRCLARRPDQRFADAIELEAAWLATPTRAQEDAPPGRAAEGHVDVRSPRARDASNLRNPPVRSRRSRS
jgi:serine/threonine protein kinase